MFNGYEHAPLSVVIAREGYGPHPEELAKQASRRMDATQGLAAILRDARKGRAPQDEVGVFRGVSDGIEKPRRTGYSAGACHRARRRQDPVAEYDGSLWSSAATQARLVIARGDLSTVA